MIQSAYTRINIMLVFDVTLKNEIISFFATHNVNYRPLAVKIGNDANHIL